MSDTTVTGGNNSNISEGNGNYAVTVGNNSTVTTGNGSDTVTAGNNSTVTTGNGNDTITGGNNDKITTGNGNNTVTAGNGSTVADGNGNNTINTGNNSTVTSGNGNNTISAGANDTVTVGNGNATITMGASDSVTVGNGNDKFVLQPSPTAPTLAAPASLIVNEDGTIALPISVGGSGSGFGFGQDKIYGFSAPSDQLVFNTSQFANAAAVLAAATQVGQNTVITGDAADTITLENVKLSSLQAKDFAFVTGGSSGSGAISITISGLPSDVALSDSAGPLTITNGSVTLTSAQLAGLTLKAGEVTSANLTVTATNTATNTSVSQTVALTVNPVAPTLTVANHSLSVKEDGSVALGISETPFDTRDVVSVKITGVPSDATLSAGTKNSDGSWSLTPAQLSGLTLNAGEEATTTLVVTATNTSGTTASVSQNIALSIIDNASLSLTVSVIGNGATVQEGQSLLAQAAITGDADDAGAPVSYQWQSSSDGGQTWSNVNATAAGTFGSVAGSLYQLTESDEGKQFRAIASFVDDTGQTVTATSAPTASVADVTPEITVPFSYAVDDLSIVKTVSGTPTQIYNDTFGQAPPASPTILSNGVATPIAFITQGSTWTESGGKAIAASTGVAQNTNVSGAVFDIAVLNTNTDPTSTLGLKQSTAFTVSSTFDLVAPPTGGYGMELTDGTPSHGVDQLERLIVQRVNGNAVVELIQANLTTNTQTVVASQMLTAAQIAGNTQIEFQMSHTANTTAVTGAFELLNNGTVTGTTTFGPTASIFTNGVDWTRADVGAFASTGVGLNIAPGSSPLEGQMLTASATTNDIDATLHYQWQGSADGGQTWSAIAGAADSASYVVQETDEGHDIRVVASTSDPDNSQTTSVTSSATGVVLDALPTVTTPTISGTAQEGQALTASASSGQSDNPVNYAWYSSADGYTNPIGTGATYVVKEGDENNTIEVKATATNDNGVTITATSAATTSVIDNASLAVSLSQVSGSAPAEGEIMVATGTITGDASDLTAPITYQWQTSSNGGATWISVAATTAGQFNGTLSSFYQFNEQDEGHIFRVQASFTDDTGQVVSTTSAPTAAVGDIAPIITQPFSFAVDEFKVVKGANTFDDTFTQGAPPVGGFLGSNQLALTTNNGSIVPVVNGKAILTATGSTPNATLATTDSTGFGLLTNTQPEGTGPGQSELGLKEDAVFSTSVTVDLAAQGIASYGLELLNGTSGANNTQVVQLIVNGNGSGGANVVLDETNLATGARTLLASQSLTAAQVANNTQIELDLAHNTANSQAITASFELYNNGTQTFADTFTTTATEFSSSTFVKAAVFASAPPSVGITGTAQEGQTLTAVAVTNDADATINYQWQESNNGTTWTNIGTNSANYVVQQADEGYNIRVVATTSDPDNTQSATATSAATASVIDNASLSLTVSVASNGAVQEGQSLIAQATITGDPADAGATVTYQWQSSSDGGQTWSNVNATAAGTFGSVAGSLYQLTESDEGKQFRAIASFVDDTGQTVTATSAPTASVADVTPEITVPFSYAVDNLSITKTISGTPTQIYNNNFSVAPPASPTILSNGVPSQIAFITQGSTWTDVGGKAVASSAGVAQNTNVSGGAFDIAVLITNTDPTSTLGLKQSTAFTVSSTFDLVMPSTGSYGMELTDGTPTHSVDQLERLIVQRMNGNAVVELIQGTPSLQTVVASQTLTAAQIANNTQIELDMSHVAGTSVVSGTFELIDNGTVTSTVAFGPTASIFTSGVDWTRADVGAFVSTGVGLNVGAGQSPREGQTLTASAATNDVDATLHYQWQSSTDGGTTWSAIAGAADSANYTVQESDEGHNIRVVASTSDPDSSQTASVASSATGAVLDAAPTVTTPTISGTAQEGQTLTASASSGQSDNPVSYIWYSSADGYTNAIGTGATYLVQETDEGFTIEAKATATNDNGVTISATSAATAVVLDAAPTVTMPTISGTAQEGQALTASASSGQSDNAVNYAWYSSADGYTNPIGTGATYVVKEGDENNTIEVKATATNDNGVTITATSAATTSVIDNASLAVSLSQVSGSAPAEGEIMVATGTITGDASDLTAPITYQWQTSSNGGATWISVAATTAGQFNGTLSSFYQFNEQDEGHIFRVQASFTDDTGQVVSTTSAPTAAVGDIAPIITQPFSFAVDEFKVVKGANTFDDTFTQGAPPVGGFLGSNQLALTTNNGSIVPVVNGKAILTATGSTPNATLATTDSTGFGLLTNTQPEGTGPGQSELGLKEDAVFSTSVTVDLAAQGIASYGLELLNGASGANNTQVVQLIVNGNGSGGANVVLDETNLATGARTLLASQSLTAAQVANNTQIELDLAHNTANSQAITASFELYNNGTQTFADTFTTTATEFSSSTFVKAAVFASAPPSVGITGTAQEGQTLTAVAVTNDADATINYQWQESNNGTTWTNIGTNSANYVVQQADEGYNIRVVATTSDPDNTQSATATSAATASVIDNASLSLTVSVASNGAVQEGQSLIAQATITGDPADAGATVTYQWQSSSDGGQTWSNVNATAAGTFGSVAGSLYQLTESDEGKQFRAIASFVDDTGQTVTATSAPTASVADVTPEITVPFSYAVDDLSITKTISGTPTQIYNNNFSVAPPASPTILSNGVPSQIAFITQGSTWTDVGGKAVASSAGVAQNTNVSGGAFDIAVLITNTDPTSTLGLKQSTAFTVSSTFDLVAPPTGGYGMELTDGTPSHGVDQLERLIVQRVNGNAVVELIQANLTTNTQTVVASQMLTAAQIAGNTQIEFQMSHTANTTAVTGAFELLNNGTVTGTTTFGPTASIFTNGVDWTRADVGAFASTGVGLNIAPGSSPLEGQMLTASATTNDIDATLHYQWQGSADGGQTWSAIAGAADSASYVVQETDEGHDIRVVASTSDPDNSQTTSVTSSATGVVPTEPQFTIPNGGALEITTSGADVTFAGPSGTVQFDATSNLAATISGFGAQDQIDLAGIAFGANTTLGYAANSNNTGGTMTVSDGNHSINLGLLGTYTASSFATSSDSHGGTTITDPPPEQNPVVSPPHA